MNNNFNILVINAQYCTGIAISESFHDTITEVVRSDDRLMELIIISAGGTIHIFIAYAPQTGRPDSKKNVL